MAANLNEPSQAPALDALRQALREHGDYPEDRAVTQLLHALELTGGARHRAVATAVALVDGARARRDERPFLDAFLQEFGLSNQEGIALMCIAEALLRIPDDATADRLIAEKLATGDWSSHAGRSESLFVNASTWGLMLTGGILELDPSIKTDTTGWMRKFTRKAGEPLVRLAVRRAMRIIGGEFVVGRSIEEALALVLGRVRVAAPEQVPIESAAGRVAAEDVRAVVDLPPFPSSAMDGYAVRAADAPGALELAGRSSAGAPAALGLAPGQAIAISTGAVVPEGADSVVPVEDARDLRVVGRFIRV